MKLRKIISLLTIATMVVTMMFGCAKSVETEATTTPETSSTTTTIPRTTEDTATTFAEQQTRKIYDALEKDSDGSYPYKIASYTTYYNANDKTRTANLMTAVSNIDDIVIPNGKVFSFNQVVGKRTVTAGYESAKVIANDEFVDGLGGGVCQVSSTVFECVLRANVDIVERTNHTLEIGYVPLGGDATVQWNSRDFQFKNTLGCDARLSMYCSSGKLTCSIYAKEDVDVGNIKIDISKSGDTYILTRTVNGNVNYTTKSVYKKPPTTTTTTTTTKKA